ncbi:MAG: hypothetical protein HQL71_03215 [Magnetococcales bacterium]|nr:hypothetical protein [Magnetococcales bacterium]
MIYINLINDAKNGHETAWRVGVTYDDCKVIDIPCKNERQGIVLADQITSKILSWSIVDKIELADQITSAISNCSIVDQVEL